MMIDLYGDGTTFVPQDLYDFAEHLDFSVRLFHRLRKLGLCSVEEVIDFYCEQFALEKYRTLWGKQTAGEFQFKMAAYLAPKQ